MVLWLTSLSEDGGPGLGRHDRVSAPSVNGHAAPPAPWPAAARPARAADQLPGVTANDLNAFVEAVRAWLRQAGEGERCSDGLSAEERAELARLRRENRALQAELAQCCVVGGRLAAGCTVAGH